MTSTLAPEIKAFFDSDTNTITYVVADTTTSACAIIDSVLDYDPASGRTNTKSERNEEWNERWNEGWNERWNEGWNERIGWKITNYK